MPFEAGQERGVDVDVGWAVVVLVVLELVVVILLKVELMAVELVEVGGVEVEVVNVELVVVIPGAGAGAEPPDFASTAPQTPPFGTAAVKVRCM